MAAITIQTLTDAGVVPTYAACTAGGDTFANDGKTILHIKNGHTSSQTVTFTSVVSDPPPGTAVANEVITVANASEKMVKPVKQSGFNDASGLVAVTYSGVVSLTIAAISIGT
ncbi:MAG TPA: hypothetical protein VII92_06340 [Anaerolineae bacterium]